MDIEPIIDNSLIFEDYKLIVSTDPCFIVSVESNVKEQMDVHLQGKILTLSDIQDILGKLNYQKEIEVLAYKEELNKREENEKVLMKECDKLRGENQGIKGNMKKLEEENLYIKKELEEKQKLKEKLIHVEAENVQLREASCKFESRYQKLATENQVQIDALNSMILDLRNKLDEKENENEIIKKSFCWKITAPIRVTGNVVYRLMKDADNNEYASWTPEGADKGISYINFYLDTTSDNYASIDMSGSTTSYAGFQTPYIYYSDGSESGYTYIYMYWDSTNIPAAE